VRVGEDVGVFGISAVRRLDGWVVGVGEGGAAVDVLVGAAVGEDGVVAIGLSVGWGVSLGAHPASTPVAMILRKYRRDRACVWDFFPQYVLFIGMFLVWLKFQRYSYLHPIAYPFCRKRQTRDGDVSRLKICKP
jgi:hypothetical protein